MYSLRTCSRLYVTRGRQRQRERGMNKYFQFLLAQLQSLSSLSHNFVSFFTSLYGCYAIFIGGTGK